ncbi:MAG: biotin-dependent carboxyltransferase family protein [Rhodobacteraceae bacterium]|nr:biotin-dependent carboxyltransferase family protein [Paracoccaceae bacterium]
MNGQILIRKAGPGLSVQDLGRVGQTHIGLSRGGAADRLALYEAAALLGLSAPIAAIEMAAIGGDFEVTQPTRIALTGAAMRASIDSHPVVWSASHLLQPGQILRIGAAMRGVYGYLSFAGGIEIMPRLGSRATHLSAGLGAALTAGARLPLGADNALETGARVLHCDNRFEGGTLRYISGPQTELFDTVTRARFDQTRFTRSPSGNRQGVALDFEDTKFPAQAPDGLASDFIQEGDIQMTGAGHPFVLLAECQTIGGYPRIGTVLDCDIPKIAQAPAGAPLRFTHVTLAEADRIAATQANLLQNLRRQTTDLIRDPRMIPDLLAYQLISGVTAGRDLEE